MTQHSPLPDAPALAREFGVSVDLMESFVTRFAPARVADGAYQEAADVMLFVHIPKTAGMSVGRSFKDGFDRFHGVDWREAAKSFRDKTRLAIYEQSKGQSRQVVMGHYGWSELQVWLNHEMPMKCGSILRDPVARTISNYNYNCSTAHPRHEAFKARFPSLDKYVASLPLDVQVTQTVGWVNSFENLLTKLIRHYTFLGVTEHLSASLAHLARSHGLPNLREYHKNVAKQKGTEEKVVAPALRKRIEDRCHNDMRLHALLMRLY